MSIWLTSADGKDTDFGNQISIQTFGIVTPFESLGHAYKIHDGCPVSMDVYQTTTTSETDSHKKWAVCSLVDTILLYVFLLRKILDKEELPHGRRGYHVYPPCLIAWEDLQDTIAGALYRRVIIDSPELKLADDTILEKIGPALGVEWSLRLLEKIGGVYVSQYNWHIWIPADLLTRSTYTPKHAMDIGWKPRHAPEHFLETAVTDAEV
jgi:hypothetical protein